jgi:hypothetical protein
VGSMTQARDDQHHEKPAIAADGAEDERINDPLTQPDVEARRASFASQPSAN